TVRTGRRLLVGKRRPFHISLTSKKWPHPGAGRGTDSPGVRPNSLLGRSSRYRGRSAHDLPASIRLAAGRAIGTLRLAADIDGLGIFPTVTGRALVRAARLDIAVIAALRVVPALGLAGLERAVRGVGQIGLVGAVEAAADIVAHHGAEQHARTRGPETAGAAPDLRSGETTRHSAGQRTNALLGAGAAIAAAISIGATGLAARQRKGKSANKKR